MTARRAALLAVGALVLYLALMARYGVLLVLEGRPVAVALGVALLVFPLIGGWVVWKELRFGLAAQRLADRLAAEGGLPTEPAAAELLPSGRLRPEAALARFERYRAEAEATPEDWRAWYRLGLAYGDARDSRRAREAMRRAIALATGE